jgi:hypothetical protein
MQCRPEDSRQPEVLAQADREELAARMASIAAAAAEMEDDEAKATAAANGGVTDWDAIHQHTTGEDVADGDAPTPAPDRDAADDEDDATGDDTVYNTMPEVMEAPVVAVTPAKRANSKGKKSKAKTELEPASVAPATATPAAVVTGKGKKRKPTAATAAAATADSETAVATIAPTAVAATARKPSPKNTRAKAKSKKDAATEANPAADDTVTPGPTKRTRRAK